MKISKRVRPWENKPVLKMFVGVYKLKQNDIDNIDSHILTISSDQHDYQQKLRTKYS